MNVFEDINLELEKLLQDISRCHKTEAMLDDLTGQLNARENLAASLAKTLEKENLDYEKISKTSITSLFYTMLGSREQQVEKERQEALAAKLKLDQCQNEIENIQSRIAKLNLEHGGYSGCEQKYKALLRKKYEMLLARDEQSAEKILELESRISSCHAVSKEIDEAIWAGNDVMRCISRVSDSLDSAEGWGTWDLLGGGLLSDLQKHSHIDDAREAAADVSTLLSRFRSELADVKITSNISIEIDGFTKFADFFFDGLISDWVVQSKIHKSQDSVEQVKYQVSTVLRKLTELKHENEESVANFNSQLADIIVKA